MSLNKVERWFDMKTDDEIAKRLSSTVTEIEKSTSETRRREWLKFDLELYTGESINSLDEAVEVFRNRQAGDGDNSQIFNVTYSIISTILNRIASFRPRAQFLPNSGDGKAKRAARNMTAMSDAWADAVDYQSEAADAMSDALTGDAGVMKIYEEDDTIKIARFPSWEFMCEEEDGRYGTPECMYHVRKITTQQAASMLGIPESEFAHQGQWDSLGAATSADTGRVRVIDAWQRGPKGLHVTLVGDRLMDDGANFSKEEWEFDGFPLVIERYQKAKTGMWGRSVTSLHRALQIELNECQLTFRESHRLSASKIIHVKQNEEAPTNINNAYVSVDRYTNTACTVDTPPALNAENYQYVNLLRDQAYETHGVSRFGAQATTKPGVTAAVAMREDTELQSDRLALLSQKWERMRVESGKWWWRLTKLLAVKNKGKKDEDGNDIGKPKWKAIKRGMWTEMVFDDIDGEYEIGVFPSSLFGHSIAGKFQKADDMIQKGWLTREDAMANMDVPDLMPVVDLMLAEQYAMEKIVDDILEDEKYTTPDPFIKKEKLYGYARSRYLLAWVEGGASAEAMNLMRRLLAHVGPPIQQPPPPPAPGAAPPGAPVDPMTGQPMAPVDPMAPPPMDPMMGLPAPAPMGGDPMAAMGAAPGALPTEEMPPMDPATMGAAPVGMA